MLEQTLTPGGSPYGWSYWSLLAKCPQQHWFKYQPDQVATFGTPGTKERPNATMIGTFVHAMLPLFYQNNVDLRIFVDPQGVDLTTQFAHEFAEATRLMQTYAKEYSTNEFSDFQFEVELSDKSNGLGVPEITGRADMVARWGGGVIQNGTYLPPGLYLFDHKTASRSSDTVDKQHQIQLQLYQHLWNLQFPETPVIGGIVNNIVKIKMPGFARVFIPPPSDNDLNNIASTLRFVYDLQTHNPQQKNITMCAHMGSICPYYSRCW